MTSSEACSKTAGEEWARRELELLLGARFSPRAVCRFLTHSQTRAAQVRRERPELAQQSRRWLAVGAAAYAPTPGPARPKLAWWTAVALMLDWHLGMVETEDGRPRPLGHADAMTLVRVWLVPLAANDPRASHVALAFATDALDGHLARAAEPTRAGRDLEGLADACFAAATLRGALKHELIPRAAAAAELTRLGVGFGYALAVWFGAAQRPDERVLRAARITTPIRAAGLGGAVAGRRKAGTALLVGGSAWSVVTVARAVAAQLRGSSAAAAGPAPSR